MEKSLNNLKDKHNISRPSPFFSRLGRLFHSYKSISGLGPLTIRSVVGLLLLLYLILGPIRESTDIVSAALTYSLLLVLAITTAAVLIQGAILKRNLDLSIMPPDEPAISGEPSRLMLTLSRARIVPFLFLEVIIEFEQTGVTAAVARVSGFSGEERRAHIDAIFPHRGSWEIRGARCSLRDVSGLARYSWEAPQPTTITVTPPPCRDSTLPIISSTQRPGELVVDIFNKQGEPFDIKSYHPSDGVKKIVWKAFAKRGELLSRHPEASMTPEGFVVIFVIADNEGDSACAHALAYARSLSPLNLDIIGGCEGGASRTPAHSAESLLELLVDSVWDSSTSTESSLKADATALIAHCGQLTPGISVNKLLIFTSAERVSDPKQAKAIEGLAHWLNAQGIVPVFFLTKTLDLGNVNTDAALSRLSRLIMAPAVERAPRVSATTYNAFLTACLNRQWEVHA